MTAARRVGFLRGPGPECLAVAIERSLGPEDIGLIAPTEATQQRVDDGLPWMIGYVLSKSQSREGRGRGA